MTHEAKVLVVDDDADIIKKMRKAADSTVNHSIQCPNPRKMTPRATLHEEEDPRNSFARINRLPLTGKKPE